jgi:uncharacterized protein YeaO (DUF488 family)
VTLRIVRLVEPRDARSDFRIGTVRHPPRGVQKERYAADDWFDVWYPDLALSAELMTQGKAAATQSEWKRFDRAFKAEMAVPTARRTLDLLAAFSAPISRSAAAAKTSPAAAGQCFAIF